MLWIMVLAIGLASTVGYFQQEKARRRRKWRERKEREKIEKLLTHGTVQLIPDRENYDTIDSEVGLKSEVRFVPHDDGRGATAFHKDFNLGVVSSEYHRFNQFCKLVCGEQSIRAYVIRKSMGTDNVEARISVTFEVVD